MGKQHKMEVFALAALIAFASLGAAPFRATEQEKLQGKWQLKKANGKKFSKKAYWIIESDRVLSIEEPDYILGFYIQARAIASYSAESANRMVSR